MFLLLPQHYPCSLVTFPPNISLPRPCVLRPFAPYVTDRESLAFGVRGPRNPSESVAHTGGQRRRTIRLDHHMSTTVETPQQEPVQHRASPTEFPGHKVVRGRPAGTPILRQPSPLPVGVIFAFLWATRSSPGAEVSAPPQVAAGWHGRASTTYLLTLLDVIILPGIGASDEHDFELLLVPAGKRQEQDPNQLLGVSGGKQGRVEAGGGRASGRRTDPPRGQVVPHAFKCLRVWLCVSVPSTHKEAAWKSITLHGPGPHSRSQGQEN